MVDPKEWFFTLLLVEDDPTHLHLMHEALGQAGFVNAVRVARDGEEAIDYLAGKGEFADRLRHPLPGLILLDLRLPKKSGLDVLEWVQGQPSLKPIPVIMLTVSQEAADIQRAYALGVRSYLVKPASYDGLVHLAKAIRLQWVNMNLGPKWPP